MNRLFMLTIVGMLCFFPEAKAADDFSGGVADELAGQNLTAANSTTSTFLLP